jgi:hypothetical protein
MLAPGPTGSIMFRVRPIASLLIACGVASCACSSGGSKNPAGSGAPGAASPEAGVGCTQAEADAYTPGMKKQGDAGRYAFELLSSAPAPPALNDNTFVMQVTDADGNPVSGELSVALDMPEHGHPSPAQPEIVFDPASNAFTLDPMRLFMVGLWRLTFSFQPDSPTAAAESDSAVFKFCID